MRIEVGTEQDVDSWMNLVEKVKNAFPGLETEEALKEHRNTVLDFISKDSAICAKEQEEIVRILDEILEKESKIKELIELEEAIELLEKSILDKAFRGELGTQNKEDEPAIELLKKIL